MLDAVNSLGTKYCYLDRTKKVCHEDKNKSIASIIKRSFMSLIGLRDYRLSSVLSELLSKSTFTVLNTSNSEFIKKTFQSLHFSSEETEVLIKLLNGENVELPCSIDCYAFNKKLSSNPAVKMIFNAASATACYESICTKSKEIDYIKKKLAQINQNEELAYKYPEEMKFLFHTRIIYSIIGYQKSTESGKTEHEIKIQENEFGKSTIYIKKQGTWTEVLKIKEELDWDKKESMLCTKSNPSERWNYFKDGLVPVDRFYHHESAALDNYPSINKKLVPIAKLSPEEMTKLVGHAQEHESPITTSDGSHLPKDCVIQFVSNPRPQFTSSLLKSLDSQIPVHCGIRVISKEGEIYSTGFGSTLSEDRYAEGLSRYLATINGQPTNLDYEEFRAHQGRVVTTLPLTTDQFKTILERLNTYREQSIRFNILKQNCMKLGTHVLHFAGVDLNIKIPISKMLLRTLPELPNGLKNVCNFVNRNYVKISDLISEKTPSSVKKIIKLIKRSIFFIPKKISNLIENLIVLSMGGKIGSPSDRIKVKSSTEGFDLDSSEDLEYLEDFSQLISGIFSKHPVEVEHSSIFINWQLAQNTTHVHKYEGFPQMNILPPAGDELEKYSHQRKAYFMDLYRNSTPYVE